ncbi:MAG TPA: ROK family transcriptional regulator, partial [Motiliproteus sp.]
QLILHLVRQHQRLTKAEATRITGLSPNAISVIFRALEADGFLLRCDPIRGRIGQPSVPMRLNPDVRRYIGFQIGRRNYRLVLVDFAGNILARKAAVHAYPTPDSLLNFVETSLPELLREARCSREAVYAFNVATPFDLWSWTDETGAPQSAMDAWRSFDLRESLQERLKWPVRVENDGTAACRAELVFGQYKSAQDWAYFFIDNLIGGGVVLNGSVYPGRHGRAGGFGPLRVPDQLEGDRLIDHASLLILETMARGFVHETQQRIYSEQGDWPSLEQFVQPWLQRAGKGLAHAIVSTLAVIDFEAIVIDGAFPANVRERLVLEVERQLLRLDLQGIEMPEVIAGGFGGIASALGAAAMQISSEFMIDQNQLLKRSSVIEA